MPTIGLLSAMPPVEPKNAVPPKVKIPPSEATSQQPGIAGLATVIERFAVRVARPVSGGSAGGGDLGLLGQTEDPFAHDVALDLGRPAPDRLGAGEEERRLQLVHRVVGPAAPHARQDFDPLG